MVLFQSNKNKSNSITSFGTGAEYIGIIKELTEATVNKIAAGEVIERPASVVKELVENSIDAGSTTIEIEIEEAGLKLIKITDNGNGMEPDDLELAFKKHSTSKIHELADLDNLTTLGFRGEALPSIASVSKVEVVTKTRPGNDVIDQGSGTKLIMEAGKQISIQETGCPEGTIIKVKDLFHNVPARKKFLKQPRTELSHITEWVMRFALAYPGIRFRLVKDNTEVLSTPATGELVDTIAAIFGASFARELIDVSYEDRNIIISGFIGKPVLARRDTSYQFIFINGRFVTSKLISRALSEAYHTVLMKNRYPCAILNLGLDPARLDVNIHPTKLMVRFMDEKEIYPVLVHTIRNALNKSELIPQLQLDAVEEAAGVDPKLTQAVLEGASIDAKERSGEDIVTAPDIRVAEDGTGEGGRVPIKISPEPVLDAEHHMTREHEVRTTGQSDLTGIVEMEFGSAPPVKLQEVIVHRGAGGTEVFKSLGQIHDSYLIIQTTGGMLIVDQHALHERVMYEKFRDKFDSMPAQVQELIVPVSLEYNNRDYEILLGYSEILKELGFDIEPFGKNTLRVRAIPVVLGRTEDREVINDILDDLLELGRIKGEELMREKIIQIMACKSAVKAGEKLNQDQIKKLLKSINDLRSPYTCAHGRPTILSLSLKDLEKQFKRIV